ncbi:MAG: hypothetical protein JJ992_22635, partial [Planctomycetes bacterium]|nr:hypothetical protein [Planctomycetota bacterium]
MAGCSRTHYRVRADREAYSTLAFKTGGTPWHLADNYSVMPDPRSRFFDPTPIDDPLLPVPAPQLYAYRLPDLPPHDASRLPGDNAAQDRSEITQPPYAPVHIAQGSPEPVRHVSFQQPVDAGDAASQDAEIQVESPMTASEPYIVPIPETIWHSMPDSCLKRMFEFASVRDEYERTFGEEPSPAQRDSSQRLSLEDIVSLAQINSREYQTQKEILYLAALRLSVERFDYDMKFSTNSNRHLDDFTHDRTDGTTVNRLGLPTTLGM